jgi:hypothetical protein
LVLGAFSQQVKWHGREADHPSQISADVKKTWTYTTILHGLMSTIEELLGRQSSISGLGIREYGRAVGIRCADDTTPLYQHKFGTNFADKQRSLGL